MQSNGTNINIELFGNYVLLEKLAVGGMAEVFLARPAVCEGDGRLLVVKRILPHIANHSEFTSMFQREIQTTMGFNHAHVVQLHDFGSVQGQPYIAMEYIEGKSLRDMSERLKVKQLKMPISAALGLVAQAASGLYYAHTFEHKTNGKPLNTIHRDISPHNLIVSFDGNLKVIDFGIAKAGSDALDLSRTGTLIGKVGYFSPEQLVAQKLDARSDIFSLGVVAWELLTGERLFAQPGDSDVSVMIKLSQCEKHMVPPSEINKDIPADIDNTILKALEKDRSNRFQDVREFQAELRKNMMKYFPDYTYADTGELMTKLFNEDMIGQRKRTKELNQHAQEMLRNRVTDKTTIITETGTAERPQSEKSNERNTVTEEVVAFRLSKIEAALKQRASMRHYLMLVIYVASLIALKFGDLYNIWVNYTGQRATVEAAQSSTSPAVAKSSDVNEGSTRSRNVH